MWTVGFRVTRKDSPERRERRFPLRVPCTLVTDQGDEIPCDSGDVSLHGLLLRCSRLPELGSVVGVKVLLPDGELTMEANVAHVGTEDSTVGLEFDQSSEGYSGWRAWINSWTSS